jgi:hypothetical protein
MKKPFLAVVKMIIKSQMGLVIHNRCETKTETEKPDCVLERTNVNVQMLIDTEI